jgi:TPR repeat protein
MRKANFRVMRQLLVFAICIFVSTTSSASYKKAFALYKDGSYEDAYYSFKNLAQIGNKPSQYQLGVMYYRGEFVEKDLVEAYAWIKLAAESGSEQHEKVSSKLLGSLDDKVKQAAVTRSEQMLSQYGSEVLALSLAPRPLSDEDCEPEPERLKVGKPIYPRKAGVSPGFVDLSLNVSAQGYARDVSIRVKTDDAFIEPSAKAILKGRWTPKVIDGVNVLAPGIYYRFSYMGLKGASYRVSKMEDAALETLKNAEAGDIAAQFKFAKTLVSLKSFSAISDKFDLEYKAANDWFLKAARQGHPLAQYELGKNMLVGRGCEVDTATGVKWLRAAAVAGHPLAQEELAMSSIRNSVSDEQRAVYWLRQAASANHYKAKLMLAWQLSTSNDGDLRDGKEALKLLEAEPKLFFDDVRVLETRAAAYAEAGDFGNAAKIQKKALKAAKRLKWEIPVMKLRLEAYQNKIPWRGYYHSAA